MTPFNPMYIPEPLDLSNDHKHRCVPHHLKYISSQGCWIILIWYRIYGDWKSGGWISSGFFVLVSQPHNPKTLYKLRRTWFKMSKIARIKSAHFQPYHHSLEIQHAQHWQHFWLWHWHPISSGHICIVIKRQRGWLIDNGRIPTDIFICWLLIDFWIEKLGDGNAFQWTHIDGWKKCQLTHPLITWPIYQRRCRSLSTDTNRQWRGQVVSISNTRHQYSTIDQYFNRRTKWR